ncbi:MAG: hypothetical protein PHZ04_01645 [Patescibacteria group bacterium]|nr:hypothetical protein [Patescibacteria group bacterium]MDD5294888.1 hypothetical protein [Patescibacteria group bacterium]MDD5554869.1 hypothetical protein [Patescibacteria group bacterium]
MKREILIKIFGVLFLVIGLFSLFHVPAEFTSFYIFMDGGNFHYAGFGFGSLMFAFIIFNAMAYFILASLGIPLGIGNFSLKKWGLNLSIATAKTVLMLGLALLTSFLFSFNLLHTLELHQTIIISTFLLLFLIALPCLLIKFYKDPNTKQLFKKSKVEGYFEKQSSEKLTVVLLNLFWASIFYLFLFFKGVFPLFGEFVVKRDGTYYLSIAIFVLLVLAYLFYKNRYYARYLMLGYYVILFIAFIPTFLKHNSNDFLNLLNLPVYEVEKVVPAFWIPIGMNLAFFSGSLIVIQMYLLFRTKNSNIKN